MSEQKVLVHNTCGGANKSELSNTSKGALDNRTNNAPSTNSGQNPTNLETELFLPDEYYSKRLPNQVQPGIIYLAKFDEVGNVKQIKKYDEYGRQVSFVDYTSHGRNNINKSDYHTAPHWHEIIYNERYPKGIKINHRTDTNTPY